MSKHINIENKFTVFVKSKAVREFTEILFSLFNLNILIKINLKINLNTSKKKLPFLYGRIQSEFYPLLSHFSLQTKKYHSSPRVALQKMK